MRNPEPEPNDMGEPLHRSSVKLSGSWGDHGFGLCGNSLQKGFGHGFLPPHFPPHTNFFGNVASCERGLVQRVANVSRCLQRRDIFLGLVFFDFAFYLPASVFPIRDNLMKTCTQDV